MVTPILGGGVRPRTLRDTGVIRVASVRGQLRFWWRAWDGARYTRAHELCDAESVIRGRAATEVEVQDLESCLDRLRELTAMVKRWSVDRNDCEVVVGFTGGTKCMTAAVALQASRWPCRFSYVGGTERTKGGVGVVVSGGEKVVHQANPWDALGHRAVEEFVVLSDQRAFAVAQRVAQEAERAVSRPERKREATALEQLAAAFAAWDRLDHKTSLNRLEGLRRSANDLRAVLGSERAVRLLAELERARTHLQALTDATPRSEHHVRDLLANARRRREEGRFEEGVARLYRASEAVAQVALTRHELATIDAVPLERVPEPVRPEWSARANDEGCVKLGPQDAWRLLRELQDPPGWEIHGREARRADIAAGEA